jgi:CubicO group peptidase (beta-lactamase class C family)
MPRFRSICLSLGFFLAAAGWTAQAPKALQPPAPAQPALKPPADTPTPSPEAAHPLDTADLTAYFDGILPLQLERSDIAGASVLVMQDGKVLLQKGYGYADVKAKKPVDPNTTIFRLASISKLFTWVSVMQLEEQGKLDLDTDVNRYLDFQIRPAFNKPITLRNLMTHTGGFEETVDDIILVDPKKAVTLRDELVNNQPMRLFPPGEVPAYSNYGVGLASYIVQRISGEPFEQYVQEHIFTPLAMTHSSFYQPLPKALADLPSEGYRGNTTKPAVGFELFNPVGAGGISSTASDMGRFGLALLSGGELDGHRILKPETLARMWTPQFQANPALPPACMGFYQDWRNNLRWIGHEGDLIAFHSLFFVEPQQKIVLFVSYNSANGGNQPRPEIIDFFSDRYFPGAPKQTFIPITADLKAIAGAYHSTRRADSTKLHLLDIFSQGVATIDKDGVLEVEAYKNLRGHTVKWKPIGKDLWQEVDGQQTLFAIRDANNSVVRLAVGFPGIQFERVPWYADSRLVLSAVGGSLAIVAAVFLTSLWRLGWRLLLRKRPRPEPEPGTIWLTFAPRSAAFAWSILLGAVAIFFMVQGDDLLPPTPDWFKWFVLINWAAGVALFLSLFAIISAIRIWRRDGVRRITMVKFTLVGLSCAVLSWFAIWYHIIGPAHRI